jgi:hypothetical protein
LAAKALRLSLELREVLRNIKEFANVQEGELKREGINDRVNAARLDTLKRVGIVPTLEDGKKFITVEQIALMLHEVPEELGS